MPHKLVIRIIAVVGGLVLFALAGYGWLMFQFKDVKPGETKKINDGLFMLKGGETDMYLHRTRDGYVAFDAGDNPETVSRELKSLGIDVASIKAVFLTHSDYDHVAGLRLFEDAEIFLPEAEYPYVNGSRDRRIFYVLNAENAIPVREYSLLKTGEEIVIDGLKIVSIPTPGHTAGSTSYQTGNVLITGDICLIKNDTIVGPLGVFTEDRKLAYASIRKIAGLEGLSIICTAHTGYTSQAKTAFDSWR